MKIRAMIVKINMKYNLKRSIPQETFQSFWKLRQIMKGLSRDAWLVNVYQMNGEHYDKISMTKGVDVR